MKHRWLVYTETLTLHVALARYYGFDIEPYRSWTYYRWRWMANWAVWFTNHVPALGIPAVKSARLLGRVDLR